MTDLYEELDLLEGIRDKVAILGNSMEQTDHKDLWIKQLEQISDNLGELEILIRRKHNEQTASED